MTNFTTYVIRMPESKDAKKAITSGISNLVVQHGGEITGISAEDEMTLGEMYAKRLEDWEAEEAREEAAALCASA